MAFSIFKRVKYVELILVFSWIVSGWVGIQEVQAVQVNLIQHGTTAIASGTTSINAALPTTVTGNRSFLVFGISTTTAAIGNISQGFITSGQLLDAGGAVCTGATICTQIRFERLGASAGQVDIQWHVIEFAVGSGVVVQRGSVSFATATAGNPPPDPGALQDVPITAVNLARAFPIISYRKGGSIIAEDEFVKAEFTSTTNLRLTLGLSGTPANTVEWQVIEYPDANVRSGNVILTETQTSNTAALAPAITNIGKTWLIYHYNTRNTNATVINQKTVRGVITNTTTLTFDRNAAGAAGGVNENIDLQWFLVEFTDATIVQQGSEPFANTDTVKNVTLTTPVQPSCSFPVVGGDYQRSGRTSLATDDQYAITTVRYNLTSTTNLQLSRGIMGAAGVTADIPWWVIEFPPCAPTAADLTHFAAIRHDEGVVLEWKTGYEVDNLGFNLYREEDGRRARINSTLIGGSALFAGARTALTAGKSYLWQDILPEGTGPVQYWLEDVDLNGKSTWHGPFEAKRATIPKALSRLRQDSAIPLSKVGRVETQTKSSSAQRLERRAALSEVTTAGLDVQWNLAAQPAIKLSVQEEGWYRVRQPDLLAAGLDPDVDPRFLQLYIDGTEQPILIVGGEDGRFDPADAIEFYGIGLDTTSTDTHVYWLIKGSQFGKRIRTTRSKSRGIEAQSFPYTVERKDRSIYFAALRNGEGNNFFGPVVTTQPVDQILTLQRLSPGNAVLEVLLQGVTAGQHGVQILFNGVEVGTATFNDQAHQVTSLSIPQTLLQEGDNAVTLVAQGGEIDVSLVDAIRLTYQHAYTADQNVVRFTLPAGQYAVIGGFSNSAIRVVDITYPQSVKQITSAIQQQGADFAVRIKASTTGTKTQTFLAFTDDQAKQPSSITANQPSTWHLAGPGADMVMIAHKSFLKSLTPLKFLRETQGWSVAVIDVEDLYDEFSFGAQSPQALQDFLIQSKALWQKAPRFVLLVGDASFDPRNYLGLGNFDFVPTKLVDTFFLETASDDWFADFDEDGLPEIAIGRLPVRTPAEASTVITKLVNYEFSGKVGGVLLVADTNDQFDFEGATDQLRALLPPTRTVEQIFRGQTDDATARSAVLAKINQGQWLVNYLGHGSVEIWRGNLLTSDDARNLTNGQILPFFINMECLNGFFHDVTTESLAEALLKAENGGAIAVWASSGLTVPGGQSAINQQLISLLSSDGSLTLGETIIRAKAAVSDSDIRRTWILFGDPSARLQ
jgi:hypothetical protein